MMQHYLIEVESDKKTRFLTPPGQIEKQLEIVLDKFFTVRTTGTRPAVKAIQLNGEFRPMRSRLT